MINGFEIKDLINILATCFTVFNFFHAIEIIKCEKGKIIFEYKIKININIIIYKKSDEQQITLVNNSYR